MSKSTTVYNTNNYCITLVIFKGNKDKYARINHDKLERMPIDSSKILNFLNCGWQIFEASWLPWDPLDQTEPVLIWIRISIASAEDPRIGSDGRESGLPLALLVPDAGLCIFSGHAALAPTAPAIGRKPCSNHIRSILHRRLGARSDTMRFLCGWGLHKWIRRPATYNPRRMVFRCTRCPSVKVVERSRRDQRAAQ